MTPEKEIERAEQARQLLDNPLLKEAFKSMQEGFIEVWYASPVKDKELRDTVHAMYCASRKLEEILRSVINGGKIAAENLKVKSRAS